MPVDFWDAIKLFESSRMGQGDGPDADLNRLAQDVVRKLRDLLPQGRIQFASLKPGEEGDVNGQGAAAVVRVSRAYQDHLEMASNVAVHEAAHLVLSWKPLFPVDEEIFCRRLENAYFEELTTRPVAFRDRQGKEKRGAFHAGGSLTQRLREQQGLLRNNRLVDHLLREPSYAYYAKAAWVEQVIDQKRWGGLANRTPETKRHFVAELARQPSLGNADRILAVLESSVRTPREYRIVLPSADAGNPVWFAINAALAARRALNDDHWNRRLAEVERAAGRPLGVRLR
jgi:hypothetical protein